MLGAVLSPGGEELSGAVLRHRRDPSTKFLSSMGKHGEWVCAGKKYGSVYVNIYRELMCFY